MARRGFWRKIGGVVAWPLTKPVEILAERAGRKAVDGAVDQISAKLSPTNSQGASPMLGTNRDTNIAGWLIIAIQVLKLLLPLVTQQPVDPSTGQTLDTLSLLAAGSGVVRAKDKRVTGVGATARRNGEK